MTQFTLIRGDCITEMSKLPANSVDSIVTDPPYELGFMGKAWDATGIANNVVMWREALRVLKPGGHLLAFSGSRTYHRMACAIDDAGFDIRDQIMWLYGSGFPKSHNGEWGGTALKPAHEPICMARKPLVGTVAANVLAHGTGGLNIDGCRVPFAGDDDERESKTKNAHSDFGSGPTTNQVFGKFDKDRDNYDPVGRWPANIIHDGSVEVLAAFPQSSVTGRRSTESQAAEVGGTAWLMANHKSAEYTDAGSAARFFYCAKASRADRNEGLPSLSTPAVETDATMRKCEIADWSTRNGNHHPTVKPTDLMAYLCRLVTPPGGTVLDPFMGSGSTGKAAMRGGFRFIGIDLGEDYVAIARTRIEHELAQPVQLGMFE